MMTANNTKLHCLLRKIEKRLESMTLIPRMIWVFPDQDSTEAFKKMVFHDGKFYETEITDYVLLLPSDSLSEKGYIVTRKSLKEEINNITWKKLRNKLFLREAFHENKKWKISEDTNLRHFLFYKNNRHPRAKFQYDSTNNTITITLYEFITFEEGPIEIGKIVCTPSS
jgi:hypothetical protein